MAKQVVALEASFDTNQAEGSVKSLKAQLREAQAEVVKMADKFGETSIQAAEAAKKAAELKDRIGDAKALTDAFNPDKKFQAFSTALQGVVGGFTAVQGAQALLGVKSEELEKTLLKVQGAMALSQGLSAITESIDAFKNLKIVAVSTFNSIKAAIGSTGIGLVVIAIGSLIMLFKDYIQTSSQVEDSTKRLKNEEEKYKTALENTTREIENRNNLLEYQLQLDLSNARARGASLKELRKIEAKYWYVKKLAAQQDFTDAIDEVDRLKNLGYVKGALLDEANKDLETKRQTYHKTNQAYNLAIAKQNEEDYNKSKEKQDKNLKDKKNYAIDEIDIELEKIDAILKARQDYQDVINQMSEADYRIELQASKDRLEIAKAEASMKQDILYNYVNSLGVISELIGQQTKVGKAFAIAQIAIETGIGYMKGLAIAQESSRALGPGAAFAFPLFYSSQILAVLQAAAKAKSILSGVKGPSAGPTISPSLGGNIGGVSSAPIGAQPSMSTINQIAINQMGNQAIHAYVLSTDVSGNQERIDRIQRAARIGP